MLVMLIFARRRRFSIPHICNFLHNHNLTCGKLTIETENAEICNNQFLATKHRKLPSENSDHELCESFGMYVELRVKLHIVYKLQGG